MGGGHLMVVSLLTLDNILEEKCLQPARFMTQHYKTFLDIIFAVVE
jgi:hypothetical protein